MSVCILLGHKPTKQAGAGHFRDYDFTVCERCGVLVDDDGRPLGVRADADTDPLSAGGILRERSMGEDG